MTQPSISSIDLNNVPAQVLRAKTRSKLCCMLNGTKVLPSPCGLPRDWRGLAHLASIEVLSIGFSGVNPIEKILFIWEKNNNSTIGKLRRFLQELDRYDAYDDTYNMMMNDAEHYYQLEKKNFIDTPLVNMNDEIHLLTVDDVCRHRNGLLPQTYDAFVLFVDSDIEFAKQLIQILEMDYGLKLCVKDRDLIGGLSFEHEAIMRLISERCNRLVVILSAEFLKSDAHKFFVNFAQAIGIEQRSRKVVPCLYKRCALPIELSSYFLLDYTRSNSLWNFWDKLRDSVIAIPPRCIQSRMTSLQALPVPPCNEITIEELEEGISSELSIENEPNVTPINCNHNEKTPYERNKSVTTLLTKLFHYKPLTQVFKRNKKKNKTPKLCTL